MISFRRQALVQGSDLLTSRLFDQDSFYPKFIEDIKYAQYEIIIESPFISMKRLNLLLPVLRTATRRGVKVIINTKQPVELDTDEFAFQADQGIMKLHELGAIILFTGGHHRKLAIIDRQVLYEGSLNILSQNTSCEIMRRTHSEHLANQVISFTGINKFVN
jgi:phosphatidylserine/phosphatidylglycerophosphate/cardiolipin synthase-like enzyme